MSNQVKEHEDQAAELRKLVNEVQQGELTTEPLITNEEMEKNTDAEKMVDILNLPPRKEVHSKKSGRTHLSMSWPLIRFVVVIVLILGVLFGLYYVWDEELLTFI